MPQNTGFWLEVALSLGASLLLGLWEPSLWVIVMFNLGSRANVRCCWDDLGFTVSSSFALASAPSDLLRFRQRTKRLLTTPAFSDPGPGRHYCLCAASVKCAILLGPLKKRWGWSMSIILVTISRINVDQKFGVKKPRCGRGWWRPSRWPRRLPTTRGALSAVLPRCRPAPRPPR